MCTLGDDREPPCLAYCDGCETEEEEGECCDTCGTVLAQWEMDCGRSTCFDCFTVSMPD